MYSIQIISFIMLLFISIIYYCVKRKPAYQHWLITAMIFLTYMVVIWEVIAMVMYSSDNRKLMLKAYIPNVFYNNFVILYFFTVYLYARLIALRDEKFVWSKVRSAAIFPTILMIFSTFFNLVINKPGERMFRIGSPFIPMCALYTLVMCVVLFAINRKTIQIGEKVPIMVALFLGLVANGIQTFFPDYKFSSVVLVLGCFAFYITVESPDAALIARLKYEKERANEANEAKSAFLANMSHEIRTPMNAIVGMTDILLRTETTDHQKSCLQNIKHSGKSLLLIINDLLDFSKIEAGKFELVEEAYDPMTLLNDVGMLTLTRIGEKPVELIYDIDSEMPETLVGDSGRIRQIMINIINNAVKYTEEGYIRVSVRLEGNTGKLTDMVIAVEDTGQGIKEEEQARLFDAFVQVDMKRNRDKDGTGLGLAICKRLSELMGGNLSVYSEYEHGSTFTVRIKQKIVSAEKAVQIDSEVYHSGKAVIGGALQRYETSNVRKLVSSFGFEYRDIPPAEFMYSDVSRLLVDGEVFAQHRDEIIALADRGVDVAIIQNPTKNSFSEEKIHVVNKPLYCANFAAFMNHSLQDSAEDALEDFDFIAPEARILVVDDIDINLKVVSGLFAPLEMQIDTATSGKLAIEKAKNTKYNIVFMDHMMPGMDGVEAIKRIRELSEFNGYYRKAPIVALTANVGEDAREAFREVDVKDFLTKPLEIKNAAKIIRRALPSNMISKHVKAEKDPIAERIAQAKAGTPQAPSAPAVMDIPAKAPEPVAAPVKEEYPVIPGIDYALGITNSGNRDMFESLLGDFYSLIDLKSTKIEKCFADGLIRDFTIEVHALKSTSRMIGAMKMSDEFKEMEALGNAEEVETIEAKLPALMEELRSFKPLLRPYAMKNEGAKEEVPKEKIIEALEKIRDTMENFDLDGTDAAMKELEGFRLDEELMPYMDSMRAYVADVAMEDIVKTANDMIEKLKDKQ